MNTYNQDCIDFMNSCEDNFFDLLDADPPYFSGPEKRGYYGNKISSIGVSRIYDITETWRLPDLKWFEEAKRISKNQIIWGANYFDFIGDPFKTPRRLDILHWIERNPIGWIVWDKCKCTNNLTTYAKNTT